MLRRVVWLVYQPTAQHDTTLEPSPTSLWEHKFVLCEVETASLYNIEINFSAHTFKFRNPLQEIMNVSS
jgi:hypothetical protein